MFLCAYLGAGEIFLVVYSSTNEPKYLRLVPSVEVVGPSPTAVAHMKSLGFQQCLADACVLPVCAVESGFVSVAAIVHAGDIFAVHRAEE